MMGGTAICGRDLRKSFFRATRSRAGSFDAVAGVTIELSGGELVELRGRSGSGKSTLLNMLAGLLPPDEGEVVLEGRDLASFRDAELSRLRNARIGVIPQGQTPLASLTVRRNVTLPALMHHAVDDADARADALLSRLGIADLSEAYPAELSGGELRRVAVARALVCGPAVVLADEPTADLDEESTALVMDVLAEASSRGAAVLVVTHDQDVSRYADRSLRMDAGLLMDSGKAGDA